MPIVWTEVNQAAPGSPLAGRRDLPATDPGDATGALVQGAFAAANAFSVDRRIAEGLARLEHLAESSISAGTVNGVLAEAGLDSHTEIFTGTTAASVMYVNLVGPPYEFSGPFDGLRVARRMPRLDGATGTVVRRYFWGVRG